MSKRFHSIDEIKNHFSIESDDLSIIRGKLNSKRTKIHPDKTKGEFKNSTIEEEYHNIGNAINYIDSLKDNQSLVIVEKVTELMKVMTELIPNNKQNSLEQSLDSKISDVTTSTRSRMLVPNISLTAVTAIVSFLFLFPNQIAEHPILSYHINPTSFIFTFLWLSLLLFCVSLWIITSHKEAVTKKKLALLKVDSEQNRIFAEFIRYLDDNKLFTKDDLTHFICNLRRGCRYEHRSDNLFGSRIITQEIAQNIAELIISRAEKNNVIERLPRNTLSDTYKLKA